MRVPEWVRRFQQAVESGLVAGGSAEDVWERGRRELPDTEAEWQSGSSQLGLLHLAEATGKMGAEKEGTPEEVCRRYVVKRAEEWRQRGRESQRKGRIE